MYCVSDFNFYLLANIFNVMFTLTFLILSVMQQTQPTAPMSATHTPANEQRWPSHSQLAAAVPDKGLHVGKDATTKSPLLQNGEGV